MNQELLNLKEQLVSQALQVATSLELELDYSEQSIKVVDQILEMLHDDLMKTGNNEGLNGIALQMGMYIVTVLEKQEKVTDLSRSHSEFGDDSFPVTLTNGNVIFPYAWCQKQIENGQQDSVSSKFSALTDNSVKLLE